MGKKKPNTSFSKDWAPFYAKFLKINGSHSFKNAVPGAYVEYPVRRRPNPSVGYFNFNLAKEMGLLPSDHPHQLTPELKTILFNTFSIQIINEYDVLHQTPIPKKDILPNRYMATRYLQLQHPTKKGETSGDGRSIWNGTVSNKGKTWDISSCGTGATILSPATAIQGELFQTGDKNVSYGCGYSDFQEGLGAALMSEVFHLNGIKTERTLLILRYPDDTSINVRTGKCLLRPSHFFHHLKQNNFKRLKQSVDYYLKRQENNEKWKLPKTNDKYRLFFDHTLEAFAKACAQFESEYIFVWMDWDGDNILNDAGIIDYGSVRQFGCFHHEYRYDDVTRYSTGIKQQYQKALETVDVFAQLTHWLRTGKKKPLSAFKNGPHTKEFKRCFDRHFLSLFVKKIGFSSAHSQFLLEKKLPLVKDFQKIFRVFEGAKSSRGKKNISDGLTWDAIFCMRDILRELPHFLLSFETQPTPKEFIGICASSYATEKDKKLSSHRKAQISDFLSTYESILEAICKEFSLKKSRLLLELTMRSSIINQADRITGDSTVLVATEIIQRRKTLTFNETQSLIDDFVTYQKRLPPLKKSPKQELSTLKKKNTKAVMKNILQILLDYRDTI